MASFEIRWKRSAGKDLKKIPKSAVGRILQVVEPLANDPIPSLQNLSCFLSGSGSKTAPNGPRTIGQ